MGRRKYYASAERLQELQSRIDDGSYLNHAIGRLALRLAEQIVDRHIPSPLDAAERAGITPVWRPTLVQATDAPRNSKGTLSQD